jgi:hypothetical protein
MPIRPDQIRRALGRVASGAIRDLRTVARSVPAEDPAAIRAALFAATPLIATGCTEAASVLAVDWYEQLREDAGVSSRFEPQLEVTVTDDEVAAMVAQATESLYDPQRGIEREIEEAFAESLALLEAELEREVADGFRDTITENVAEDPAAGGWRRFARPEACKFCLMLAARGAVYTKETVRFAAHGAVMAGNRKGGNCMCIAAPAFGGPTEWTEATPIQYVASQATRTQAQRDQLRAYLNKNFPDAPG